MSHRVKIKSQFKHLDLLTKAFESLGWEVKKNIEIESYYTGKRNVGIGVVHPGAIFGLEIVNRAGLWDIDLDIDSDYLYQSPYLELGDRSLTGVKKQYALAGIQKKALENGHEVEVQYLPNGAIEVNVLTS